MSDYRIDDRYRAQDKWVFLCQENTDENWSRLCQSFEQSELGDDARFSSAEKRAANNEELVAVLDGFVIQSMLKVQNITVKDIVRYLLKMAR